MSRLALLAADEAKVDTDHAWVNDGTPRLATPDRVWQSVFGDGAASPLFLSPDAPSRGSPGTKRRISVGKEAADTAERWGGHAAGRMRTWAGTVKDTLETTKHTLEEKVAARRRGEHEPDEHRAIPAEHRDTREKPAASEAVGDDQTGG